MNFEKKIINKINNISHDIINNIITPSIGDKIGEIIADCNLTTIRDYTFGNGKLAKKILNKIFKYGSVKRGDYAYLIINEETPLNLISLILLDHMYG